NGEYTVDAINADALGAGQKVDFDVLYEVKQTVLESNGSIAGWVTSSAHLTGEIVGLDTNDNAPVWATDPTQTVAENTTLVATLLATDADATAANNTVAYSITGGADKDLFDIVGGNLVFKSAPDYEAGKTSFAVVVTASDGLHPVAQTFTVNLSDA